MYLLLQVAILLGLVLALFQALHHSLSLVQVISRNTTVCCPRGWQAPCRRTTQWNTSQVWSETATGTFGLGSDWSGAFP